MSISKLLGATMVAGAVPSRRGTAGAAAPAHSAGTAATPHAAGPAGARHVPSAAETAPAQCR